MSTWEKLTRDEILLILELIREKHGVGYVEGPMGRLQAKLSILLSGAER